MSNRIGSALLSAGFALAFAVYAQAQTTTTTPAAGGTAAVTATCKDGTSFSGASKRGACAGHGGVKSWGAASTATNAAPPANAAPMSTPTTKQSSASQSGASQSGASQSTAGGQSTAAKPGGGPGYVWVNTQSKTYHCVGSRWYGKTKTGEYMSEQAAKQSGFHAARNETC